MAPLKLIASLKVFTLLSICVKLRFKKYQSLSTKRYDGNNFTPTACKQLRGQNTLVEIRLLKITKPSDVLNCKPNFNDFFLTIISNVFFLVYICVE